MSNALLGRLRSFVKNPIFIVLLLFLCFPAGILLCFRHFKTSLRVKAACCILPLVAFFMLFFILTQNAGVQSLSLRGSADLSPLTCGQARQFTFTYLPREADFSAADIVISDDTVLSAALEAEAGIAVLTADALTPGNASIYIQTGRLRSAELALTIAPDNSSFLDYAPDAAEAPPGNAVQGGSSINTTDIEPEAHTQSTAVYITPSGKRYHHLPTCGGSGSYLVSIDTIGSRTPCQKCVPE